MINKTVWMLSTGSYSDYSIMGIYDDFELAEKIRKQCNCEISEMELNYIPDYPEGFCFWDVEIMHDGEIRSIEQQEINGSKEAEYWFPRVAYEDVRDGRSYKTVKFVLFQLWARDKNHAAKIAGERRTRLIASGEWTDDEDEWRKRRIKETPNDQ